MRKLSLLLVLVLLGGFALELAAQEYTYTSAATNMHRRDADLNMTKRWLDEYFDVQFDWVVTENQFEKLNVLLAAGEIPDMIAMRMNPVQLATYADQGVLAELSVDTIREVMPEYYAHVASFGDERVWKYGEIDGKHMGLPIIQPVEHLPARHRLERAVAAQRRHRQGSGDAGRVRRGVPQVPQ